MLSIHLLSSISNALRNFIEYYQIYFLFTHLTLLTLLTSLITFFRCLVLWTVIRNKISAIWSSPVNAFALTILALFLLIAALISAKRAILSTEKTRISTKYSNDVQLESSQGMVQHWYDNYFLAYGYQTLRNSQLGGGSKRKVFYFNKLVFN